MANTVLCTVFVFAVLDNMVDSSIYSLIYVAYSIVGCCEYMKISWKKKLETSEATTVKEDNDVQMGNKAFRGFSNWIKWRQSNISSSWHDLQVPE